MLGAQRLLLGHDVEREGWRWAAELKVSPNLSGGSSAPVHPKVPVEGWQRGNEDPRGCHLLDEQEAGPQPGGGCLRVLP